MHPGAFHQQRILRIAGWLAAAVSVALVLPFVALATFKFMDKEDLIVFSHVVRDGLWGTLGFYISNSVGARFSAILAHSGLAALADAAGLDVWDWARLAAVVYFAAVVGGLAILFRSVLYRLPWTLAVALAAAPVAFLQAMTRTPETLTPFILANYSLSLGLYAAFLGAFIAYLGRDKAEGGIVTGAILMAVTAAYLGTHETAVIAIGVFLPFAFLIGATLGGPRRPIAVTGPLGGVEGPWSLRPGFDGRGTQFAFLGLAGVWLAVAALQMLSKESQARAFGKYATRGVSRATADALDRFPDLLLGMFSLDRPYFLAMFALVFFVARLTPLNPALRGRNRFLLLIPIPVFLATTYGAMVAMMIWPGGIADRVKNVLYGYGFVASALLAVFLAHRLRLEWLKPRKAIVGAGLAFALLLAAFGRDDGYRLAVSQAFGDGYRYSRGVAERMDILTREKGGEVFVPEIERPPFWILGLSHGPNEEAYFQGLLAGSVRRKKVWFVPCAFSGDPSWCHYRFNPRDGRPAETMPPGQYTPPGQPGPKIRPEETKR